MKRLLLLAGVFCSFLIGYGFIAEAYPNPWPYGRNQYRGFFNNLYDTTGKYVLGASCSGAYYYNNGQDWCNAFPLWMDTPAEFTNFIEDKLDNGNSTDRVGAAVIIQTMAGTGYGWPTASDRAEFRNRVNAVAPYTWWGTGAFSYNLNSYNQQGTNGVGPNDVAFYDNSGSNHQSIVFRNSSGAVVYVIKRRCANPVGFNALNPLPPAQNFSMVGSTTLDNNAPFPGQMITFNHFLQNNGPTATNPTNIWWIVINTVAGTNVAGGNAGTFANGELRNIYPNEQVTIPAGTPAGTQICRAVGLDPTTQSSGYSQGTTVCATVRAAFSLTPTVNAVISSGGAPISGNFAEQGDTVVFTYAVNNSLAGPSVNTNCNIYGQNKAGYQAVPVPHDSSSSPGYVPPPTGCPRNFPANTNTTIATENVTLSTPNQSVCRSLFVNPATPTGGPASAETCVYVANKPYARVYGGDISAGNGLITSPGICSANGNAAVVGWNKRAAGNFAGAGAQYAIYALNTITDFASSLYSAGGAAAPIGLSFANTSSNIATGNFGGSLGSSPCIPDYYSNRPATTLAIPPSVAAMVSGVYGGSGNITLGGGSIVNPNNRITVYVDGNVFINSNITYSGSWNTSTVPLFELVVRGNIYIDNDVTQLDGVYVAQANGAVGGEIHTCATGFASLPQDGTLFANCDLKLTVNGLFVAKQVFLLRTIGTLSQSANAEPSGMPHITEVFNFGPALWMAQPVRDSGTSTDYDAIISLPPIL